MSWGILGGLQVPQIIGGANLELWLRSDVGYTLVSGAYSNLKDLSGHGRDASQATAGNRPAFTASALNGRPGMTFDGATSNRFLAGSLPITEPVGGQGFSIVTVAKMSTANQSGGIFDSSNGTGNTNISYMHLQNGTNRSFRYPAANDLQYAFSSTAAALHFSVSTHTGVNAETKNLYDKTVLKAGPQNQTSGPLTITQYRIGRLFQNVFPFAGDIYEVQIYSKALSANEMTQLTNDANRVWGI